MLALAGRGAFCVSEFTEILGQSQPRLSRHLKLLCDCGLLERVREGAYGTCESCAGRIPAERLKYQPAATRCVECQSQWDRMNLRTA